MPLTVASSGDERALAIRSRLLTVVCECGRLQIQLGTLRLIVFETGRWVVNHWPLFNALSPEEVSSPGYRCALERQHMRPELPYGLDVWSGAKVLNILWSDQNLFEVAIFVRGSLEEEALSRGSLVTKQPDSRCAYTLRNAARVCFLLPIMSAPCELGVPLCRSAAIALDRSGRAGSVIGLTRRRGGG